MSWIRLDDRWDEHPKVLAVSEAAALMWLRAIAYSNRNRTAGFVPNGGLHRLTTAKDPRKLAEELANVRVPGCESGLFDRTEGGYTVHDIADYQPSADGELPAKVTPASVKAKRSEAGKRGAAARWQTDGKEDGTLPSGGMANDGKPGCQADASSMASLPPPDPVPVPVPVHTHTPARACVGPEPERTSEPRPGLPPPRLSNLATAEVLLEVVGRHPKLRLLHGNAEWARGAGEITARKLVRAEDAEAAVEAFLLKSASRVWSDVDSLSTAIGGYLATAKQYGDRARAQAAKDADRGASWGGGHSRNSPAAPNPSAPAFAPLDGSAKPWSPE